MMDSIGTFFEKHCGQFWRAWDDQLSIWCHAQSNDFKSQWQPKPHTAEKEPFCCWRTRCSRDSCANLAENAHWWVLSSFWQRAAKQAEDLHLTEAQLLRRRKVPRRFTVKDAEPEHPATPYDYFKRIYYEALDLIINCINSRFNQPGYKAYC